MRFSSSALVVELVSVFQFNYSSIILLTFFYSYFSRSGIVHAVCRFDQGGVFG